jgi:ComEC/Rec2-related protein
MKRPLVPVALLFGAGVVAGNRWPLQVSLVVGASFLVFLMAAAWARARTSLLCLLCFLVGWANILARTALLSPHDLRRVAGDEPQLATIRGILVESPSLRQTERRGQLAERTVIRVDVREIQLDGRWQPARGQVALTCRGALASQFFRRQRLEAEGVIKPPPVPVAENLFDYRAYLRHQGIHHQFVVDSTNDCRLAPGALTSPPWSERFLPWAQRVLARGLPEDDEGLRLVWAMVLGWKTALTDEVDEPFMRSGTMHVFAISGLHIALIAGIVVQVLRLFRVQRAWCGGLAIPLIWFYVGATGWQSSAIRSAVMMSIVVGGWALARPGDLLNSLAAAAVAVLAWDPAQLFQAGFQLSFGVVLSLALLLPPLEARWSKLVKFDPLLPDELRPRWQQWLAAPLRWLGLSLATTIAAWIGSLPLTWHYFHLVNPVSLLANLLIVPLSSLSLAASVASLLCGDWLPGLGEVFNHSAWLWMTLMVRFSRWFAQLPGGCWYAASPAAAWFAPYYLILLAITTGWGLTPARRRWLVAATALWLGAAAVAFVRAESRPKLTLLPSGQGAFFDAPGSGRDLLVDCGSESSTRFIVTPFLHGEGVDRLATFAASHGDVQHVGGALALLESFRPRRVLLPDAHFRSPAFKQLVNAAEEAELPVRHLARGEATGAWRVLHPDAGDRFAHADDNALVLLGEFDGLRVLLCSDLGRHGQYKLLERGDDLRAEVVVAGVPHENEPLGDLLLDAIQPRLVVITDGEFPAPQRTKPVTRERLGQRPWRTLYTSLAGAVTLRWNRRTCDVSTAVTGESFRLEFGPHPDFNSTESQSAVPRMPAPATPPDALRHRGSGQ